MKKATQIYKGIGKLLKAYGANIFDGKITTIIGLVVVGVGIYLSVKSGITMEVIAYLGIGLGLIGVKDPSGPKNNQDGENN